MDTRILNREWGMISGKLRQRFGQLTDEDLLLVEGREQELMMQLQQKLGKSWKELNTLLADLILANRQRKEISG